MDETHESGVIKKFPWTGRFQTKAEIDRYFAGDKVRCLLCGKTYKALHGHLIRAHDVTPDDYRERYGLPWRRGLCGVSTSERLSTSMLRRRQEGFSPDMQAALEEAWRAERRQDQPFFAGVGADNLKPIIEKITKYADKDFKNVLVRMLNEKKGLNEACKEAGMPHFGAVSKYAKKNAKFREDLERAIEQLPYSVQAGAGNLPKKKFREDILSSKRSGITVADMSRLLGVSRSPINNRLKKASEEPEADSGGDG